MSHKHQTNFPLQKTGDMKKLLLFCCCKLFLFFAVAQQSGVSFCYDASGNRMGRTIVLSSSQSAPQQSPQQSPQQAPAPNENEKNDNDFIPNNGTDFLTSDVVKSPENNEISNKFYTDKLNESDVVIFPNPTRGALAVQIQNRNPEISHQLTVFNSRGSIVFQRSGIENFTEIDLSAQPTGVYLLRISSQNSFISWKIIKE